MGRPTRYVHQGARHGDELVLGVDTEGDLPVDHVERLVPRVAVRRRAAALWAGLAEDLVAAGLCAGGEDGDLLADDLQRCRRMVGDDDEGLWHRMLQLSGAPARLWSTHPVMVLVYHEPVAGGSQVEVKRT